MWKLERVSMAVPIRILIILYFEIRAMLGEMLALLFNAFAFINSDSACVAFWLEHKPKCNNGLKWKWTAELWVHALAVGYASVYLHVICDCDLFILIFSYALIISQWRLKIDNKMCTQQAYFVSFKFNIY